MRNFETIETQGEMIEYLEEKYGENLSMIDIQQNCECLWNLTGREIDPDEIGIELGIGSKFL